MTKLVDARGLKCPLPVLLARRALKTHPIVTLLTDDPASVLDVPVFAAREGYEVETVEEESYSFVLRRIRAFSANADSL